MLRQRCPKEGTPMWRVTWVSPIDEGKRCVSIRKCGGNSCREWTEKLDPANFMLFSTALPSNFPSSTSCVSSTRFIHRILWLHESWDIPLRTVCSVIEMQCDRNTRNEPTKHTKRWLNIQICPRRSIIRVGKYENVWKIAMQIGLLHSLVRSRPPLGPRNEKMEGREGS